MRYIFVYTIRFYKRYLSPFLVFFFGAGCRFEPTCSVYSMKAFENFGVMKGFKMSLGRISRCHPFYKGDLFDPIPKE